jgi:hypothetical protein
LVKLKYFLLFIICLSFPLINSCVTLNNLFDSIKNTTPGIHWSLGQYVNEWNEPLGKYYIRYEGGVSAMLFTGSSGQEKANIRNITFSESEGLTFLIPSGTGMRPVSSMAVDVIIKLPNEEDAFSGFYSSLQNKISIDYSQRLRDALLNENVIIRLSMSNAFYRYQFDFPEKFIQAYGILMNNKPS